MGLLSKLSLVPQNTNKVIGMEIDDCEIRAVELDFSTQMPVLSAIGRIKLDPETMFEGVVRNPAALAGKLFELVNTYHFSSEKILLGLGSSDLLIRFAKIPKIEPSLIYSYIKSQAQEYFPISIQEYSMDTMVLTPVPSSETFDIIIVAARNTTITNLTTALELAKLNPYEIDISSLALMKFGEFEYSDATIILANVAYGRLDTLILNNEVPVFAKSSFFSATHMQSGGKTQLDRTGNVTNSFFNEIANEIKTLVNYCYSLPDAEPASAILLCGPGSSLEGLDTFIANQTKTNTLLINPFKDIVIPDNLKNDPSSWSPDFAVCMSIVSRGLEVI